MRLTAVYRELALELGLFVTMLGGLLLFFTTLSLFYFDATPQELIDLVRPLHDTHWDMWGFFAGILIVIIGALVFGDKLVKHMEFKRLLNSPSRATFIKNRDRLEFLAWRLTKRQEKQLEDKMDEWGIKY